ncbi:histone-lysine N-methyltransferase ash1, partial [Gonapodya prolifera JEL478]
FGLRTLVPIAKGSLVCEYRGEIISEDTCLNRMSTIYANNHAFYMLEYQEGEVIDAHRKGTEARFVNHSCDPNCHIEKWGIGGEYAVGLFASEDIPARTELTYDYRYENVGQEMQKCLCGASKCRGFI